ncbi:dynein axonemal intermediate chain 1-like isoform X2 [Nerophis lumbriciformis]|uniref:dynein axonemal intermediate chain 1-like isoform X2 n=1 Tax=Nerophis lumbriciformis TaxID=546530 RepID=UPI002ADF72A6|nr:dynein axonemal intermediate chain 1-like isoform X2 [Nerophis lumbriciformis]
MSKDQTPLGKSHKSNKKKDEEDPGKLVKPADQLDLSDADLKEEITKMLIATNPHAPENLAHYKFSEGAYKVTTDVEHLVIHFSMEGVLDYNDDAPSPTGSEGPEDDTAAKPEEDTSGGEEDDDDRADSVASKASNQEPKSTNQFNFIERASQTFNNPLQGRSCQTIPPPRCKYAATASQWEIFDAYKDELHKQEILKEKLKPKNEGDRTKKKILPIEMPSDDITRVAKAAKLFERMVNQNTFNEISQDFRYYEDAADEFREQEGTLLPLWKFQYEKAKTMCVTALCWNVIYPDFFGVGLGSYEFSKQGRGMLLFYTLKNSTYPEYIFPTSCGVLCLDVHKQHSYLVAVGFYDGCVGVYNLKNKGLDPEYKSTSNTGKHSDPVWQVRWQKDNSLNFYSVSCDGRVVSWTIMKNELVFTDAIRLMLTDQVSDGLDGIKELTSAGGTSMDFHRQIESLFLVGTEEGKIHKCSKNYSNQYLATYDAHNMAVDTVKWNPYHPKVFISCSSDWTVKIWDHDYNTPMFTFDLNASVGDVVWAPNSSTVFTAVTTEGLVHVFDLAINKYQAICQQPVVPKKKTKLTHIAFNPIHPVVIVGDDRGTVISLKLSPNLRKKPKGKKGRDLVEGPEAEVAKMEKLLSLLRELEPSKA